MPTVTAARNRRNRYHLVGWRLAAIVLLTFLAGGCEKSSTASVSGKVTYKGQPVVHGDVTFFQPGSGRVSQAAIDSEGNYSLNLSQGGLPTGRFKIIVTPEVSYVEVDNGPNGKDLKMVTKGEKRIPPIFQDRKSTPLSAMLTGGEDSFDLDLE